MTSIDLELNILPLTVALGRSDFGGASDDTGDGLTDGEEEDDLLTGDEDEEELLGDEDSETEEE